MKKILLPMMLILGLSSCKEKPVFYYNLEDGVYVNKCELDFDTLKLKDWEFYISRSLKFDGSIVNDIEGSFVREKDSLILYPSNVYYDHNGQTWEEVQSTIKFKAQKELILETTKPLHYIGEDEVTEACTAKNLVKL